MSEHDKQDLTEQQKIIIEQQKIINEIMAKTAFKVHPLSQDELNEEAIQRIIRYAGYYKQAEKTADAGILVGTNLNEFQDTPQTDELTHDFAGVGVFIATINFISIPLWYLSAYLSGQKPPMTLTNGIRWSYSGILLALAIAAFVVPPAAPWIAFAGAGVSVFFSGFYLARLVQDRMNLRREIRVLDRAIDRADDELDHIKNEAAQLQTLLSTTTEEEHLQAISLDLLSLQERYHEQKDQLHDLYNQQLHKKQLADQNGTNKLMFRCINLALASLMIIGLVLALVFPPVGIGLVCGVVALSATYLLARSLGPLCFSLWAQLKQSNKAVSAEQQNTNNEVVNHIIMNMQLDHPSTHLDREQPEDRQNESTKDVLNRLVDPKESCDLVHVKARPKDIKEDDEPPMSPLLSHEAKHNKDDEDGTNETEGLHIL